MSAQASMFESNEGEALLAAVQAKQRYVYPVTEVYPLKERLRGAILDTKLDGAILGRSPISGKCETFAEAFERIFSEPIKPSTKRKGK